MVEEEAIVPKIRRKKKEKKKLYIPFLNILLVLFCTFLIVVATFLQLDLKCLIKPVEFLSGKALAQTSFLYTYKIIPQVPAVMFIAGLLGRRLGLTSVIIYILIGLFLFPVFALGGGLGYITEFSFGYIIAYIPAVFYAGTVLSEGFSFKNIVKAALVGVVVIHFVGIIYMLFIAMFKHEGYEFIKGWILAQSLLKILYDYILSLFALYVAKYASRYIRYILY